MNGSILALAAFSLALVAALVFALLERHRERARADALQLRLEAAQAEAAAARERAFAVEEAREAVADRFSVLSAETLDRTSDSLLRRADAAFELREKAAMERITGLMKPVADTLARFEEKVTGLEAARLEDSGGLKAQIEQLLRASNETRDAALRLHNALRRGAGVQGRWGEETLRNVLEAAGLTRFDFQEQVSTDSDDGRRRPDVVVQLPGGGVFVIDAKVALTAFLEALELEDAAAKDAALTRHAQALRQHMISLSAKAYWDQFDRSPDFVVLFVPGDGFLAAALDRLPELMSEAMDRRVVIVTPTTLFALCKAVAYGWRAEDQAAGARQVAELGKVLYKRLSVMGDHANRVGKSLGQAVEHFNAFAGSLESQVLSQARRFEELKVDHEGKELSEIAQIESAPRILTKL